VLRVFEDRVLRRIFGPKRDEITREWGKLHNEELHNIYFSANIIRVIKSRRTRWARNVARMGKRRSAYRVLVGKPGKRDRLEDPCIDGRIILRWIFRKRYIGTWTGSSWLRIGTGGGYM
jgi:hypothetical protein